MGSRVVFSEKFIAYFIALFLCIHWCTWNWGQSLYFYEVQIYKGKLVLNLSHAKSDDHRKSAKLVMYQLYASPVATI